MNRCVRSNMKIHRTVMLPCGLCLFVFLLTSCNSASVRKGDAETVEFSVKRVEFKDSLQGEDGASYYSTSIDLPVSGPDTLVSNIKNWINDELGGEYKGEIDCDTMMMRQYAQDFFKNEIDIAFPDSGSECSINKVAETDQYVSYETDGYAYTGGAHGMPFRRGVTFCKQNGQQFAWNLFLDGSQLRDMVRNAIVTQYFEGDEERFKDLTQVMIRDGEQFPLPQTAPWLLDDSVMFVYQAYEIAPYVAGQPNCRIAIKDLVSFFSDDAKTMLIRTE